MRSESQRINFRLFSSCPKKSTFIVFWIIVPFFIARDNSKQNSFPIVNFKKVDRSLADPVLHNECAADANPALTLTHIADFMEDSGAVEITEQDLEHTEEEFNILESAQSLQASFSSLKNVFSTDVYKGFLGFATWWSYFTLFATSALGIIYQSYFNNT